MPPSNTMPTISGTTSNGSNVQRPNVGARGNQSKRRRQRRTITTNTASYQGECDDFGYILALKSEKFDKKLYFQSFLDKVAIYVVSVV